MSQNQQPFKNNEIKRYRINPLLTDQPSFYYLLVRANLGRKSPGNDPAKVILLVDTGASYTILPENTLNRLGYDTKNPLKWHPGLITGKGKTQRIPIIQISSFFCLNKEIIDFPVLAYTLPRPSYWDGVLGIDFLTHFRAVILLENAKTGKPNEIRLR